MAEFVRVAGVADVPPGTMRPFVVAGRRIVVCAAAGSYYAVEDLCSHDDAELSAGFFEPDDWCIECPLHGARFDVRSGRALSLPAFRPVMTFAVRVVDDSLLVALPGG